MASTPAIPILDEDKYRTQVLRFDSAEAEQARAQQLTDEARQLGLNVPEMEISAPMAASVASGMVDHSSPLLSSGSSTARTSAYNGSITPSHAPSSPTQSPLDQAASLSELTIASERAKAGSTRSMVSLSTRPTSYCSSENRPVVGRVGYDGLSIHPNRNSTLSIASVEKKEKRKNSLMDAIGRFHFRRKRPSNARGSGNRNHDRVEQACLEKTPASPPRQEEHPPESSASASQAKVETPLYDKEALQRSLDNPELSQMLERHRMERNRHLVFQDAALSILRHRHQIAITERQNEHERQEDEKRDKNITDISDIEERQLAREIEQQREFERAKMNSRTRIKYMEGYFQTTSPPASPTTASTGRESSESFFDPERTPPARRFTQQQKDQLEQQYHVHESMDALHEARIKVLRDRQEKKLQEAMARLERELNNLCAQNIKDVAALQSQHRAEETSIIKALDSKKTQLRQRWHLEEAILRRHLEDRTGQPYGPLPPVSFSAVNSETRDSAICVPDPSLLSPGSPH